MWKRETCKKVQRVKNKVVAVLLVDKEILGNCSGWWVRQMRPNNNKKVNKFTKVHANARYVRMSLKVIEEVGCSWLMSALSLIRFCVRIWSITMKDLTQETVTLSKIKSAGMRMSDAGMLTVGAFEVGCETWVKRLVWKTGSEKRKTCGHFLNCPFSIGMMVLHYKELINLQWWQLIFIVNSSISVINDSHSSLFLVFLNLSVCQILLLSLLFCDNGLLGSLSSSLVTAIQKETRLQRRSLSDS